MPSWRTRVEVAFLEFSHSVITNLTRADKLEDARDVAVRAFEAQPDARDVERKLIALYRRLGSRAAAEAQYAHYAAMEAADGLEVQSLAELCSDEIPSD